jgi:hypothetical protein
MKLKKHLEERGMNTKLYRVSYNYYFSMITFFLYNLSGQLIGYHQYRPLADKKKKNHPKHGRYYTYVPHKERRETADPKPRNVMAVFGLERVNPYDRTIYIVEGIFKASVLHRLGFNAIAVLTATPKPMKPWFFILRQTWNLVAIGDPDKGGQMLVNTVGKGFLSPIDLDEMEDQEILELLKINS